MKKKYLFMGLCMIISLLLAACSDSGNSESNNGSSEQSSNDDTITLSYAFFSTENTYPGMVAKYWADELEKRSNGKVKVELYYGGTLLDATNMLDGVQNKVADIGLAAISYETGKFPLLDISDMPNNYGNAVTASKVANNLVDEFLAEQFGNVQVLKTFATEPMYIQTSKKVDTLDSLKGLQIRASSSSLLKILEKFGAAGVGMSQAEQLEALQTGIIQGTITERGQLTDSQLAQYIDYISDYQLGITTLTAFMNKETWNSLPEDVQKIILELKEEIPEYAGKIMDEKAANALAEAQSQHGVQVVPLKDGEKEKFDAIIDEVRNEFIEEVNKKGYKGTEYAARIKELVEQYSK